MANEYIKTKQKPFTPKKPITDLDDIVSDKMFDFQGKGDAPFTPEFNKYLDDLNYLEFAQLFQRLPKAEDAIQTTTKIARRDVRKRLKDKFEKKFAGQLGSEFDELGAPIDQEYERFDRPKEKLEADQKIVMDNIKVAKALAKDKPEPKKNLGFFGNMIEKLKTDADARQKFFDQLGGIGAEISRPTEPGEARSLARDLIVGSEQGEKRTIGKRQAEAKTLADAALARQRANPMQYYTTAMKELSQEAVAAGLIPGTKPFITYIGEKLRGKGLSANLASYSETLKNLNEQLLQAQAAGQDTEIIIKQIKDIQGLITGELGGTSGGSNDVPYKPQ